MSNALFELLSQQADLADIKPVYKGYLPNAFRVKQTLEGGTRRQCVRVVTDISNTYALKRQKDLLHFLNQYSAFLRFNEIRKVGMAYLQFFDVGPKRTLASQVAKKGVLSPKAATKWLLDTLGSLQKLHAVGFVHSAIQPEHCLYAKKQSFLVGLEHAKVSLSSVEVEQMGKGVAHTGADALYCPPERLNGQFDDKGDVYALGCTLYFALTGQHVYRLTSPKNAAHLWHNAWMHTHATVHKAKGLPSFWFDLVVWMTQKTPSNRPDLVDIERALISGKVPKAQQHKFNKLNDLNSAENIKPKAALQALADAHFLRPMFEIAQRAEANGEWDVALSLYENAAFKGFAHAQARLGEWYETGEPGDSIKQNYAMAANFYQQALQKGHAHAAYKLANLFEHGLGMPINMSHARQWYKFAALRGDLSAQTALANLYQQDTKVAKSLEQAKAWLALAEHSAHVKQAEKQNQKQSQKQSQQSVNLVR
ncbi:Sel1-like repeat-containing protein kinase family protein [Thiomicrorhabdus aquaedulcis]|uniref:Sel1-like repeat-containing protein kinase family protein n=1 Tax=Thiomicrorhabdus aquaedulcis TaxID=2211106 RepID=UPI000FDAED64|nr:Sel1-like repeat-containing protein kinase family protein [Thiomicrorhabdus aquaedulcis]